MIKNEIIPTLFALDSDTFKKKLSILEFAPKIHIDFMDGQFVTGKSVLLNDMKDILKLKNNNFQIHLMALNPCQYLNEIKKLGISKVLIQEEVFDKKEDIKYAINCFKKVGLELYIVLNPTTQIDRIKAYLEIIDGIMLMSVWPGEEGQEFIDSTYDKIKEIREYVGEGFPIQIDGGVRDTNAKRIIESGANILNVGSYISSSKSPKDNYEKLKRIVNS